MSGRKASGSKVKYEDIDFPNEESFDIEIVNAHDELVPVTGPFDDSIPVDTGASLLIQSLFLFPSTVDVNDFDGSQELFGRRLKALELAAEYLEREFGTAKDIDADVEHLNRQGLKKFKAIVELLEEALHARLVRFKEESTQDDGLQPCSAYFKLMERLQDLQLLVIEAGYPEVPDVPIWGKEADDNIAFWGGNDYEILSVCFRYDVQKFLSEISACFDGKLTVLTYHATSVDKGKEKSRDVPPHISSSLEQEVSSFVGNKANTNKPKISVLDSGLESIRKRQLSLFSSRSPSKEPSGNAGSMLSKTKRMTTAGIQELFAIRTKANPKGMPLQTKGVNHDDDDPDSSDSDDGKPPPKKTDRNPFKPRKDAKANLSESNQSSTNREAHFDLKLKPDQIPEWNGDPDTLALWVLKVNALSKRSVTIFDQLGQLVPTRLKDEAESWYYSLPADHRDAAEENWESMRDVIGSYYMNRSWLDKQKMRARAAHYREVGHTMEKPSGYYIRKSQLMSLVFNMSDSEIIMEVMNSAPSGWTSILTTHLYETVVEFQAALKFHEDILISIGNEEKRRQFVPTFMRNSQPQKSGFRSQNPSPSSQPRAKAYQVGWNRQLEPPKFPKDDATRTKRNKTPGEAGARACRHCGSLMHWDNECKYSPKAARMARANFVTYSDDYLEALEEYEDLYLASDNDEELGEEPGDPPEEGKQDF